MRLKNQEAWDKWVSANNDPYGRACIKVAKRVMELLDKNPEPLRIGYYPDLQTVHGLIVKADKDTRAGGISGFMAKCVVEIVFQCHERGEEFCKRYNETNHWLF